MEGQWFTPLQPSDINNDGVVNSIDFSLTCSIRNRERECARPVSNRVKMRIGVGRYSIVYRVFGILYNKLYGIYICEL